MKEKDKALMDCNSKSVLSDLIRFPLQRDSILNHILHATQDPSSDRERCLISNQPKPVPHNLFLYAHLPSPPQCQQFLDIFTLGFARWLRPAQKKKARRRRAALQLQTTWMLFGSK